MQSDAEVKVDPNKHAEEARQLIRQPNEDLPTQGHQRRNDITGSTQLTRRKVALTDPQ